MNAKRTRRLLRNTKKMFESRISAGSTEAMKIPVAKAAVDKE